MSKEEPRGSDPHVAPMARIWTGWMSCLEDGEDRVGGKAADKRGAGGWERGEFSWKCFSSLGQLGGSSTECEHRHWRGEEREGA